ncbi:unnamed protein product [Bursaphelenchus xylophilus]|uniref:(pine wood nematode) hypothetical protein n=1 Tax=Bursaphelenchus xylophilus TaxID=6326 RepID=A0A1I7SVY3_BURXY|nr:unnamed protein product [Bursaphelenchus xylophilus]CAG9098496.1 unnamed protein product [Bursaphelenchus xylophilus]
MGFKDPRDPRDPWAWRNTWTGEARTSYDELWVVIPLVALVSVICFLLLLPLMVYKFCPFMMNKKFKDCFEKFLQVLHDVGKEKTLKNTNEVSFDNPSFVRPSYHHVEQGQGGQKLPIHLRSSTRSLRKKEYERKRRTRSCPQRREHAI